MAAMEKEFQVRVITPEKIAYEHAAVSARFPGVDGLIGVLANHAPMIEAMAPGILRVCEPEGRTVEMFVSEGFVEVRDNVMKLVCEAGELPEEVDLERAKEAEARARALLADRLRVDVDLPRAEAALQRALFRQRLATRHRERAAAR